MGRLRVSRALRARAGVLAGGSSASAGVGLGFGLAAGLVAAGVLLVAYCLLLMDVDGGSP
jgi:hypothetical protein